MDLVDEDDGGPEEKGRGRKKMTMERHDEGGGGCVRRVGVEGRNWR